ncbi:hypothetical protein HMPREF9946_03610 [Acetobacteraceae bacterium AT-5844]|nr:hypothetical protein HMPREF9946_03610 [Acetobacteraceae bacterium AT-5844]
MPSRLCGIAGAEKRLPALSPFHSNTLDPVLSFAFLCSFYQADHSSPA